MDDKWTYKHIYELYGIVTHMGSMSGGHYIAYVCYKYENIIIFIGLGKIGTGSTEVIAL